MDTKKLITKHYINGTAKVQGLDMMAFEYANIMQDATKIKHIDYTNNGIDITLK